MRKLILKYVSILLTVAVIMNLIPANQASAANNTSLVFNLVTGGNITVGSVTANFIKRGQVRVTYSLSESARNGGWLIYETNTLLGNSLKSFKRTFENGTAEFTADYSYDTFNNSINNQYVAVRAVIKKVNTVVKAVAPYAGSRVYSFDQGDRYDGGPVMPIRSNPNQALEFEQGMNQNYFYSLGFQTTSLDGWIIIEYDNPIANGPGNDIRVIEDTYGLPYPAEVAEVFVSKDRLNWVSLGTANNQNPISLYHTISEFDLNNVGMTNIKYVKIQDRSIREDFKYVYASQGASSLDGFDLNAVLALQDCVVTNTCSKAAFGAGCIKQKNHNNCQNGNNGFGNGDQDAPGKSLYHNGAENDQCNKGNNKK